MPTTFESSRRNSVDYDQVCFDNYNFILISIRFIDIKFNFLFFNINIKIIYILLSIDRVQSIKTHFVSMLISHSELIQWI